MTDLINKIDKTFNFNENTIRVIGSYNEPWFVVKDICNILGLSNVTESLRNIPETWKKFETLTSETLKSDKSSKVYQEQGRNMIIINEPAVYKLIMRSNKPIAQTFQEHVCEIILPSIRKTGEYKLQEIIDKNKQLEDEKQKIEEKLTLKNKQLQNETIKTENLKAKYECFYYRKLYGEKFSIDNCVYIIGFAEIPNEFKMGSTNNLNQRLQDFNTEMPYKPIVYCVKYISNHKLVEKVLHYNLRKYKIFNSKEWFRTDDKNILISEMNDTVLFFENADKKYEHVKDIQIENKELCDKKEESTDDKEESTDDKKELTDDKEELTEYKELEKTKKCPSCDIILAVDKFAKNPKRGDYLDSYCKECNNNRYKENKSNKNSIKIQIVIKSCSKCLEQKNIEEFYNRIGSSDGKTSECKDCTMKLYEKSKTRTDKIDVETKKCLDCDKIKDISDFSIKTNSKDGHASYCKICISDKGKKMRQDNVQICTLSSKTCNTCKEDLPIESFWNCKTNKKDGKDNKCITCHKKKGKALLNPS